MHGGEHTGAGDRIGVDGACVHRLKQIVHSGIRLRPLETLRRLSYLSEGASPRPGSGSPRVGGPE